MGPTTRICSTLALGALAAMMAAKADARRIEPSGLALYATARVADAGRDAPVALDRYREALTLAPDVTGVAFRAYRSGVDGGDFDLALRAAQSLERMGTVPPDAHLLLYIAEVRARDWRAARRRLARIGEERGVDILVPMLADWLALVDGVTAGAGASSPGAYANENDALIAVAAGDFDAATTRVRAFTTTDAERATLFRLAVADGLARRGEKARGVALLGGTDATIAAGRIELEKRRRIGLAVETPAQGAAYLLARLAEDLRGGRTSRTGVTLARLAVFADPQNPAYRLGAARALAAGERLDAALAVVEPLRRDPILTNEAASLRIDLLDSLGRGDAALAEAAARPDTLRERQRRGDIEFRRGNFGVAADHYRAAIALGEGKAGWPLLLAAATALERSDDWTAARALLEAALALAPNEPALLNQLGYGLADRGETVDRAFAMLRVAIASAPDNAAITDSLGWAEFQRGRVNNAIPILERARVLDPSEPEIADHLGDAYWVAGRRIEARYAWRAAREALSGTAAARIGDKIARGLP